MALTVSQLISIALGVVSILWLFAGNAFLYRRGWPGARVSALEGVCYVFALAALLCGWYINIVYLNFYGAQAGWWHWTKLLFANPASASGAQDLIIANLILFPLWTIVEGRRRGMKLAWLYFPMSALTSYAFAFALFLALQERQLRWNAANRAG